MTREGNLVFGRLQFPPQGPTIERRAEMLERAWTLWSSSRGTQGCMRIGESLNGPIHPRISLGAEQGFSAFRVLSCIERSRYLLDRALLLILDSSYHPACCLQLYITMLLRLIVLAEGAFRSLKLNPVDCISRTVKAKDLKQGVG